MDSGAHPIETLIHPVIGKSMAAIVGSLSELTARGRRTNSADLNETRLPRPFAPDSLPPNTSFTNCCLSSSSALWICFQYHDLYLSYILVRCTDPSIKPLLVNKDRNSLLWKIIRSQKYAAVYKMRTVTLKSQLKVLQKYSQKNIFLAYY